MGFRAVVRPCRARLFIGGFRPRRVIQTRGQERVSPGLAIIEQKFDKGMGSMAGHSEEVEVDDAVVLLLGAPGSSPSTKDRIEGITRLEKLVFLLQRETPVGEMLSEDPGFEPYNFGPFSRKVYEAIDLLRSADLVTEQSASASTPDDLWESEAVVGIETPDPYATRNISLTDEGRKYYDALVADLPSEVGEIVSRFKQRFATIPLRQLVRYVYERYPEMTERSIIKDDILGA
jgi:uncharacterized protein